MGWGPPLGLLGGEGLLGLGVEGRILHQAVDEDPEVVPHLDVAMGQKPNRLGSSEHPNPTTKNKNEWRAPKWDPIGFDPQPCVPGLGRRPNGRLQSKGQEPDVRRPPQRVWMTGLGLWRVAG